MRLASILTKEIIQLLQNPKMRATLLVPPVLQLIILGYAATLELKRVDFGVLDYSQSQGARELTARFAGNPTFNLCVEFQNETEMRRRIDDKTIKLALVIPPDFEEKLAGKETPDLQVIVDGRSANSGALASAYAANIVSDFFLLRQGNASGGGELSASIRSRAWFNPNFDARLFMAPSVLALIALIDMILLTALSMAKEREEGTFDQLRLTPAASWEILTAKGLASVLVGAIQTAAGLAVVLLWFRVPLTAPFPLLATVLLSFLLASMGIGLLISVVSRNLQQAILSAFLIIIPFSLLSGLSTPAESMPPFFQRVSLLNPLRHGVAVLPRLFLEGTTFAEIRYSLYFLWGIALTGFSLSVILFNRQRQGG